MCSSDLHLRDRGGQRGHGGVVVAAHLLVRRRKRAVDRRAQVVRRQPLQRAGQRLDHALLAGPNIVESAKFFTEVLGFDLTEELIDHESGTRLAMFVSCSNKPHDIAFQLQPLPGKFHHVSFYLESIPDVYHAGDIMGKYNIPVDVGPTRHGITRGATIYFFDPSGNRNEVFSGGDRKSTRLNSSH